MLVLTCIPSQRKAFKRYLIVNPPPILVFHLKRFEQITGGRGFNPFGGFTGSKSLWTLRV